MNQFDLPLLDSLKKHDQINPISLHVPGHKYGQVFINNDSISYFSNILKIDATELTGLDDFHSPEEVILRAEKLLAEVYGVHKSFFLVNGSTVGNLAMIMAAINENDIVLVQRNCHKSILNAIHLAKANPVFLAPDYDEDWGVVGGVSLKTVQKGIERYSNCKAIILTYPNYYGMTNDLKEIVEVAHQKGIPVLIDEAHGAHFIAGDFFPLSAVQLGADVVVQSAHKTLPAMTMGSFLHVNSELVSTHSINGYLRMLQSSSPSYPIMASLDIARSYIGTYSKKDIEYLTQEIYWFKNRLKEIEGIRVLSYSNQIGDPLKVTIQSTTSLSGYHLQKLLEAEGIFTELADPYNVLFVLPLLKEGMNFSFNFIIEKIEKAFISLPDTLIQKKPYFNKKLISELAIYYKDREGREERILPLDESIGCVSAENLIPYPPGVPLLLQGELISNHDIQSIRLYLETGARFQGGPYLHEGKIKVYTERFR